MMIPGNFAPPGNYPNPDAVVYPTGFPQPFPCQLTSRDAGKSTPIHNHGAWLDEQGNGNTDTDAGHFHRVRGFRVLADPSDGHTHTLTMQPCGAGAPRTTGPDGPVMMPDGTLVPTLGRGLGRGGFAGHGPGLPTWVWVVGTVVVLGGIAAAVVAYRRGQDEE